MYNVRVARRAERYVNSLPPDAQQRIADRLGELEFDPFDARISKPITNAPGRRSSRVGDWRIIYAVDAARRVVDVSTIAPRGRAYRDV